MAVLRVLTYGDEVLRKPSKEVKKISSKIKKLVNNMIETMYAYNGVGLAAPQVGENYRIFVIDVSMDNEPLNPIVFINPKIIEKSGAINSNESCLSLPNAFADVRRYENIKVKALNLNGKSFVAEGKDGTLFARALQHEYDHLEGVLFIDHSRNRFATEKELEKNNLPPLEIEKLLEEPDLEEQIQKNETVSSTESTEGNNKE